ncbi:MAG TPA: hypothetical protein VFF57_02040 [Hanamia sp.]|nr:hypothetical protein [Hanamia sp.]
MKNLLKKILFLVFVSLTCTHAFAQGPADPGNDPIVSSNQINQNIQVPVKKTGDKNENVQINFNGNVPHWNEHKTLIPKIYFSDYSKYHRSETKISFANAEENERKLKFILSFVSFSLHQI